MVEQLSDGVVAFDGVPKREVAHALIGVAPPVLLPAQIAALDEIADDLLGRAFGDADG